MLKKIKDRLMRALAITNERRIRYARSIGVAVGNDSRFMDVPFLGSEPWLISIGKKVTISDHVTFLTHDGGTAVFRDKAEFRNVIKYGKIVIEDGCFIGSHAIIMPNVRIGAGSVIGAASVVTKSVPGGEVWAGNPAHKICTVQAYAEKCRMSSPVYDAQKYMTDKRTELLRILPEPPKV